MGAVFSFIFSGSESLAKCLGLKRQVGDGDGARVGGGVQEVGSGGESSEVQRREGEAVESSEAEGRLPTTQWVAGSFKMVQVAAEGEDMETQRSYVYEREFWGQRGGEVDASEEVQVSSGQGMYTLQNMQSAALTGEHWEEQSNIDQQRQDLYEGEQTERMVEPEPERISAGLLIEPPTNAKQGDTRVEGEQRDRRIDAEQRRQMIGTKHKEGRIDAEQIDRSIGARQRQGMKGEDEVKRDVY